MKLTKKYFRENLLDHPELLRQALVAYGDKCTKRGARNANFSEPVSNDWNGSVEGLYLDRNAIYAYVYWQGDSTDGHNTVEFNVEGFKVPTLYDPYTERIEHSEVLFGKLAAKECLRQFIKDYLK